MRFLHTGTLAALACLPSSFAKPVYKRGNETHMAKGFDEIKASPDLKWTPCFDEFTCTKLEVPLDYDDETAGTTEIAFIKWNANVTSTANSTQDILLNPGGPGGSGVSMLRWNLPKLLDQFGFEYNLVSFDPRGVGASGPSVSCFPGEKGTARFYDTDLFRVVDVDDERSLREAYAKSGAFGEFCTKAHSTGNDSSKYVNTIATATDMLHYTELLAESKGQDPDSSELWYYGVSYGTILGTTFAALFPDRVGRMILDGVADGEDYYSGKWRSNLVDADASVRYFFESCYKAGKNGSCPFWDESPEAIEERFNAIMQDIEANPISVSESQTPAIITTSNIKTVLRAVPYSPLQMFPAMAEVLVGLETRNTSALMDFAPVGIRTDDCSAYPFSSEDNAESVYFIGCNDADGRYNLSTYDSWVEQVSFLHNQSEFLGEAWATSLSVNCHKLDIKSPKSQVFDGYPSTSSTKNPLLFISAKIDPVTPLSAARKMSALFDGAGLLVQNSVGHASFSSPSKCTHGHIRQYMKDGSLPDVGTTCEPNTRPFEDASNPDDGAKMLRKRGFL